jgi:hypothetical protein
MHMAEQDADQRGKHVEGDLLCRARAHARRAGNDLWWRLQQDRDIGTVEQDRTRIVGHGDNARAFFPGIGGNRQRIGRAAACRNGNHTVAGADFRRFGVPDRQRAVVFIAAGEVFEARGAAGEQDDDAVAGNAVGAGKLERIGHGHQAGASCADIDKAAAGKKRFSGKTGGSGDIGERAVNGGGRGLLAVRKHAQRVDGLTFVQPCRLIVPAFCPACSHSSFSSGPN